MILYCYVISLHLRLKFVISEACLLKCIYNSTKSIFLTTSRQLFVTVQLMLLRLQSNCYEKGHGLPLRSEKTPQKIQASSDHGTLSEAINSGHAVSIYKRLIITQKLAL